MPLFKDHKYLRDTIREYIQYADVLKISDEEVEFIFGNCDIEQNLNEIFDTGVQLIIYTAGKKGAYAYTKNTKVYSEGKSVHAIDTTGAGDGFIGCLLYQLSRDGLTKEQLSSLTNEKLKNYLDVANRFSAISVTKEGAIASYPEFKDII